MLRRPSAEPLLSIVEALRINSATKNLAFAPPSPLPSWERARVRGPRAALLPLHPLILTFSHQGRRDLQAQRQRESRDLLLS